MNPNRYFTYTWKPWKIFIIWRGNSKKLAHHVDPWWYAGTLQLHGSRKKNDLLTVRKLSEAFLKVYFLLSILWYL